MKHTRILLIIFPLFGFCVENPAQENPFLNMAGKKYAEYSQELWFEFCLQLLMGIQHHIRRGMELCRKKISFFNQVVLKSNQRKKPYICT
jgi:hypothetical protein